MTLKLTYDSKAYLFMLERTSRIGLIALAVISAIFPALFADKLQNHVRPFVVAAIIITTAALLWQRDYDSREARRLTTLNHKLDLQEGRSTTLTWMIKILTHPILLIEQDHDWTHEQKLEGAQKLSSAMTQILRALSKDISVYVGEKSNADINTNLMIAHRVAKCSSDQLDHLAAAAKFMGYRRSLAGYSHALELILWGREEADIPPLVLPVEDPREEAGKRRLLPGAAAAFALNEDRFVPDTRRMREYTQSDPSGVGADLDPDVLHRVDEYFRSKSFRSFASLVLRDPAEDKPIGVLNIQSNEPERFSPHDIDMKTLIKTLEHYRFCLQYLLNGQRKLLGIV